MYQWQDVRTYRVNDGETQESATGVDAQTEDAKNTEVWISDTLIPAPLVISKQLVNADGTEANATASDTEFTFTITLTVDETKDIAAVRNPEWKNHTFDGTLITGEEETAMPVEFKDGVATVKLKAGQRLSIQYLPVGVDYVVAESPTDGYKIKAVDGTGTSDLEKASTSGTISTEQAEAHVAAFTNEKSEIPTVELQVTKQVIGSNYTGNEDFSFRLTKNTKYREAFSTLAKDTDVLPSNTTVQTKAGGTATFGSITYTEPGWYFYNITEVVPATKTEGMTYDTTDHMVLVQVDEDLTVNVTYGMTLDTSKYAGLSAADLLTQYAKDLQDGTAVQNVKDNKLTITNYYTPPSTPPSTTTTTTKPTTTTTKPTTTTTLAKTSDDTNWTPVAFLAIVGVGIVAFGATRRRRQQ